MQFRDLKKQYDVLKQEIDTSIFDVIQSTFFINGPQVKTLEVQLAKYVGIKHCITCLLYTSYPYQNEYKTLLGFPYLLKEKFNLFKLKKYIDYIVIPGTEFSEVYDLSLIHI